MYLYIDFKQTINWKTSISFGLNGQWERKHHKGVKIYEVNFIQSKTKILRIPLVIKKNETGT